MKILIIEDEQALQKSIREYFSSSTINCETADSYRFGLEKVSSFVYDCIILDLNLPGGNGLDILKQVKKSDSNRNVVIITARNSPDDRVTALYLGADDYLVKPFYLSELKASVMNIVYKNNFIGNNTLIFNEITIDLKTREVKIKDKPIDLNDIEYELLIYFVENTEKNILKNAISEHIWKDEISDIDLTDRYVLGLKGKLLQADCFDYLQTIYKIGYRFSAMQG